MRLAAILALGLAAIAAEAQEPVAPFAMSQLNMLLGEWQVAGKGGMIDFRYSSGDRLMIGRAKALKTGAKWRNFMLLYSEGKAGEVRAEFYEANDRVIHYRLNFASAGKLRFEDDPAPGLPRHRLTYEEQGPDRLTYRFLTGNKIVESGVLIRGVDLRPLAKPPLIRPLSE